MQLQGEDTTLESSDEYFDATDASLPVLSAESTLPLISPSISISVIEGDPPEIEEDKDFHESADFESKQSCQGWVENPCCDLDLECH